MRKQISVQLASVAPIKTAQLLHLPSAEKTGPSDSDKVRKRQREAAAGSSSSSAYCAHTPAAPSSAFAESVPTEEDDASTSGTSRASLPWNCRSCGRPFSSHHGLMLHILAHHPAAPVHKLA
eukprot:6185123-Pleurochrysis_carterae.AAC.1